MSEYKYGDYTVSVEDEVAYLLQCGVHNWKKVGPFVCLTGLFAGPSLWFKPLTERVEIATRRLMAAADRIEAKKQQEQDLHQQAQQLSTAIRNGQR